MVSGRPSQTRDHCVGTGQEEHQEARGPSQGRPQNRKSKTHRDVPIEPLVEREEWCRGEQCIRELRIQEAKMGLKYLTNKWEKRKKVLNTLHNNLSVWVMTNEDSR